MYTPSATPNAIHSRGAPCSFAVWFRLAMKYASSPAYPNDFCMTARVPSLVLSACGTHAAAHAVWRLTSGRRARPSAKAARAGAASGDSSKSCCRGPFDQRRLSLSAEPLAASEDVRSRRLLVTHGDALEHPPVADLGQLGGELDLHLPQRTDVVVVDDAKRQRGAAHESRALVLLVLKRDRRGHALIPDERDLDPSARACAPDRRGRDLNAVVAHLGEIDGGPIHVPVRAPARDRVRASRRAADHAQIHLDETHVVVAGVREPAIRARRRARARGTRRGRVRAPVREASARSAARSRAKGAASPRVRTARAPLVGDASASAPDDAARDEADVDASAPVRARETISAPRRRIDPRYRRRIVGERNRADPETRESPGASERTRPSVRLRTRVARTRGRTRRCARLSARARDVRGECVARGGEKSVKRRLFGDVITGFPRDFSTDLK